MIRAFRLSSGRYPANSGAGAALSGGRWNPIGVEVLYAASTPSLAALEVLAHFSVLPRDFVLTEIRLSGHNAIEHIPVEGLPPGWDSLSPISATQEFGARWVLEMRTPVLSVPSSIVPIDRNFVINTLHPDFSAIQFLPSQPFQFDPRLK